MNNMRMKGGQSSQDRLLIVLINPNGVEINLIADPMLVVNGDCHDHD